MSPCISLPLGWCKVSLRPSIPLVVALLLFFFYCIIFYCPSAAANKRISVLFCSVLYDMSSLKFVPYVRAKGLDAVSVV